jgi:23S rRNA-/tRNA-specific pseudouridylate synthase
MYGSKQHNDILARDCRITRQMLHSYRIRFSHPKTGKMVEFKADIPKDMSGLFKNIKL